MYGLSRGDPDGGGVAGVYFLPLMGCYRFVAVRGLCRSHAVRVDVAEWSDSGLVGVVKRHKERQEEKRREGFAQRIFRQDENLDVQWVDIDGQRFYRNHRSRRYKVRLGDRAAEYYNLDGNEVPVYDGKRQTRKRG